MNERFKTVAVIGLGYIGLPTAAIIAAQGIRVIGVDVKESSINQINRGEVPFVEPDLEDYLKDAVDAGLLSAQRDTPPADAYMVAVPTPFGEGGAPNLSYINAAADAIAPQLRGGELIVLESTSPPGTTESIARRILSARSDLDQTVEAKRIHFAHCPERVLPGQVMREIVTNDRIVGGFTPKGAEMAKELYEIFCTGEVLVTDARTAEMAKLVENSYRDVNIAFANELSIIADKLEIDVWELIELANHHPRVNILQPGPGVGGHCIAVDPWFIVSAAPDESKLIRTAREVNDAKPNHVLEKVAHAVQKFEKPTIAALGLAFKPDIDDLRSSPALAITEQIATRYPHAQLLAVEPNITALPETLAKFPNVKLANLHEATASADLTLLLVDHSQFKALRKDVFRPRLIIDTRGALR